MSASISSGAASAGRVGLLVQLMLLADLLDALEAEWREARVARCRVSMRSELTVAVEFYRHRGFVFEQERQVLGRPMTYFTKEL